MEERFKRIELREDGFLEVSLKRMKDFDDYIYQQMQKDNGCLPCVRDPKLKTKLYYDTKGYVNLRTYLQGHVFDEKECLSFLIYVFENMVRVNTAKPILMDLDHMYLSYDGGIVRFLIIPVIVDQWVFQKEESHHFLEQLLQELRLSQGYEAIGYLSYMQRFDEMSLPMVLQGLHDLEEQHKIKPKFIERILHLHREEEYFVRDIPLPKAYPQFQMESVIMEEQSSYAEEKEIKNDIHNETVVLLQEDRFVLFDEERQAEIAINKDVFTIGRAKDNDFCIPERYISAHHACIHRRTHEIEDLSSSNGTYVNNNKINRSKLNHSDKVSFATKSYRYVMR